MKGETCLPLGCEIWRDTAIQLPCKPGVLFRNLFTGNLIQTQDQGNTTVLRAKDLFADFPVALLDQ
jgi:maltooligosyltrehalose synthase